MNIDELIEKSKEKKNLLDIAFTMNVIKEEKLVDIEDFTDIKLFKRVNTIKQSYYGYILYKKINEEVYGFFEESQKDIDLKIYRGFTLDLSEKEKEKELLHLIKSMPEDHTGINFSKSLHILSWIYFTLSVIGSMLLISQDLEIALIALFASSITSFILMALAHIVSRSSSIDRKL